VRIVSSEPFLVERNGARRTQPAENPQAVADHEP